MTRPFQPRLPPPDAAAGADPATVGPTSGPLPAEAEGIEDAEALRIFRRAAQLDPHDPDYHYILGQALLRGGRLHEAARAFGEAVQLLGREPDYHYALGVALWELGRHAAAEAAFRDALRLGADDPRALNGLGCSLIQLDRHSEAVGILEAALAHRLGGGTAALQGNLALALWGSGRAGDALRTLRSALDAAPDDAELHRALGSLLLEIGRPHQAVDPLAAAVRHRPGEATRHLELAEALHAAGRDDEAEAALAEALHLDPSALAARPQSQDVAAALRQRRLRAGLRAETAAEGRPGRLRRWVGGIAAARWPRLNPRALLLLGAVAAVIRVVWVVAPPYYARFLLEDDIAEVARAPVRDDADIRDRLAHVVRRRGLDAYVDSASFEIHTLPKWRRVACRYQVPVQPVPGLTWTLHFHIDVERPYFLPIEEREAPQSPAGALTR
jgi:Flp pilus assembly protein TadD